MKHTVVHVNISELSNLPTFKVHWENISRKSKLKGTISVFRNTPVLIDRSPICCTQGLQWHRSGPGVSDPGSPGEELLRTLAMGVVWPEGVFSLIQDSWGKGVPVAFLSHSVFFCRFRAHHPSISLRRLKVLYSK